MTYPMARKDEGWGVYRTVPWHIHGIYLTRQQADQESRTAGKQYHVAYGYVSAFSDEFRLVAEPRD